jgi:diaphanous 1
MRLPRDRKVYLLRQNRHFKTANQRSANAAQASASYGPSSGGGLLPRLVPQLTGDAGLLKRISIIGWGSGTPSLQKASQDPTGTSHDLSKSPPRSPNSRRSEELIQPQTTGGTWGNWWASTGHSCLTREGAANRCLRSGISMVSRQAKWLISNW